MAYTFNMIAPAAGFNVVSATGTSYTADGSGLIKNVSGADVNALEAAGCIFAGNLTQPLPLSQMLLSSGQPLPATATTNEFGLSYVPGTGIYLIGEATSSASKTDYVCTEFVLPNAYLAGSPFNIIINAQITSLSSGTATASSTIVPVIYKTPVSGTQVSSENLVLTAAQALSSTTSSAFTFLVNGNPSSGALVGGQRLLLQITGVAVPTGGGINHQINSVSYQIA